MKTPSPLTRIAIGLALVSIVPLLFASWQLVSLNRTSMRDQVLATNILAARTLSEQLTAQLESWYSLAESLTEHPSLQEGDVPALGEALSTSLGAWGSLGVLGVAVVDPEGQLVVGSRARPDLDLNRIAELEWQRWDLPDEEPGNEPEIAFDTHPYVRAAIGEIGFVVLAGDAAVINGPLKAEDLFDTTSAQVFAIDLSGRVVAGKGDVDALPRNLFEAAISGRLGAASPFVTDPTTGEGDEPTAYLAAYNPVGRWPLRVISVQPREVAEAVSSSMRQRATLIVALAIALVALLLAAVYASVVRPLRRLLGAQRRLALVGSGDTLAGDAANGDLIQELESTFSALEERVRDSEQLGKVFLGRYQVIELVGRGGMGTVFKGWDPKLERPVALKTVRIGTGELDDSPEELREKVTSLLKEAVLVAQLNHPNVVTVYDFEELAGSAFLAMELVDGITLEQLHYFGEIEATLIAPLGLNLARALEAAHARAVLHRDIKSPNVLLGRDHSVKVVDFGLAQLATATKGSEGLIFGTPGYVAPEVIQGDAPGEAADNFALGVVLYESATAILPFSGVNIPAILRATVHGDYEPLKFARPGLDEELLQLVEELLQTDPGLRPSAIDARVRLENICRRLGQVWRLPELEGLERDDSHHTTKARAQWIQTTTFGMPTDLAAPRKSQRRAV